MTSAFLCALISQSWSFPCSSMRSPALRSGNRCVRLAAAPVSALSHTLCSPLVTCLFCLQVMADQPLTASRRRQLLLNFLQAKLEAEDDQLLLEGARVREAIGAARQQQRHALLGQLHNKHPMQTRLFLVPAPCPLPP